MTLPEKLLEQGIRPRRYTDGAQKLTCPRCSHTRRDQRGPSLSLTIDGDGAVWNCHHCHWAGRVKEDSAARLRQKRRLAAVRPQRAPGEPTAEVFAWLAARGNQRGGGKAQQDRFGASLHPEIASRGRLYRVPLFPEWRTRKYQIPCACSEGLSRSKMRKRSYLD